jgi:hypothetical protein
MSQSATAYFFYGFPAPEDLSREALEFALAKKSWYQVGYVTVGPYGGDKRLYVVTFCQEADTHKAAVFSPLAPHRVELDRDELLDVAAFNEWPVPDPQWFVAADLS